MYILILNYNYLPHSVSGATLSGKTRLVLEMLKHAQEMFEPVPKQIILMYQQLQDQYYEIQEDLAAKGIRFELIKGYIPTLDDLKRDLLGEGQTLLVMDDMTEPTAKSPHIAEICMNARHSNLSLWLCWHSLYPGHRESRIISQNCAYYWLLPFQRGLGQLGCFAKQVGLNAKMFSAAYQDALSLNQPHRYLLVDLRCSTPAMARVRTNVLPNDSYQYIYRCT